jgi:hypothetical protein
VSLGIEYSKFKKEKMSNFCDLIKINIKKKVKRDQENTISQDTIVL